MYQHGWQPPDSPAQLELSARRGLVPYYFDLSPQGMLTTAIDRIPRNALHTGLEQLCGLRVNLSIEISRQNCIGSCSVYFQNDFMRGFIGRQLLPLPNPL